MRAFTIQMTILPKLTNINIPKNLLERFTKGHTSDYIFSGHTLVILIIFWTPCIVKVVGNLAPANSTNIDMPQI